MKKVSAIIVNWNGKKAVSDCIESLLRQDFEELEIIVSDNGSIDGSVDHIRERYPSVHVVANGSNLGFGTAVNRGLSVATGDAFLFLNNDLVLEPNSISELAALLQSDERIGAAVPKILYFEERDRINSYGVLIHYTGVACPHLIGRDTSAATDITETACGGIFLFKREIYEAVGGFDEDFFLYHEDHDLSWRIRLAGWRLMVTPKAVLYHHYHFNKGTRKFYSSEKNRLHLLLKNLAIKTLVLISPALFVVECAQWVHALLNGWFRLKIRSYVDLAALAPQIFKKRRHIRSMRKIPDSEVVRLYQGRLAVSGMKNPLLDMVLNPLLQTYWNLVRPWI